MNKFVTALGWLLVISFLFSATPAYASETVVYYHTDPAGTPLAMTDSRGNIAWNADYRPFGEEQSVTGTADNNRKFVGKEKDSESGLSYFGARYLKSDIGRFISPDSVGAVDPITGKENSVILHDPQRLNQYAYGLNNPYRYVDADGRMAEVIRQLIFNPGPHLRNGALIGSAIMGGFVAGAGYQAAQDINISGLIYNESSGGQSSESQGPAINPPNTATPNGPDDDRKRGLGGWHGDPKWQQAKRTVHEGGDIKHIDGKIPTREEAQKLITETRGTLIRNDPAHNAPNPHNYPHINYRTSTGFRSCIRVLE